VTEPGHSQPVLRYLPANIQHIQKIKKDLTNAVEKWYNITVYFRTRVSYLLNAAVQREYRIARLQLGQFKY